LIEQSEALGEPPENPLLLYSVLYGFWVTNVVAFNGDAARVLAEQFLELAEKQGAPFPILLGHGTRAFSLLAMGDFTQSLRQSDQALALYDPAVHRPLAMLFGQDARVTSLCQRSLALWFLGYPDAALAETNQFLKEARQIGQVGTLFFALNYASVMQFLCGAHATADALANELFTLAEEQGAVMWKAAGLAYRGWILAVAGMASEAVQLITSGLAALRPTGTTLFTPVSLSLSAKCYADLGQADDAWRCIDEAKAVIERTKETWFEANVHRLAGEVALMPSQPDMAKAEAYFERALEVARQQQAKSWELRAAMSMARLWRDQGKRTEARDLLAPVYGWFTEGFDTRDLKEAKALLEELAA
jgi:predicted ATPase